MKPFIETYMGETFSPLKPDPDQINIEDIAHSLARQCRFTGHSVFFYSVAEHSVRVAELLEKQGWERMTCLWGLLHDASEAYLVDLPTPLKRSPSIGLPYQRAERHLMWAVCERFGLPISQPAVVGEADAILLATEVRDLMHGHRDYWRKIQAEPMAERIRPWSPEVAEYEFDRKFYELGGEECLRKSA